MIPVGNPAYNRMEDQSGSSSISIAGGPVRGNNYLLDGVPITDAANRAIIIPSLEAVQEVKVQANTYDAEMARTGGGMFNTLMKSGSNDYHGSLYGHLRRTAWDANNFFSNAGGIPIANQPNDTWGASFGGPVRIPKVYNGKNKTFFWIAVEHYDDTQAASSIFSAPTALERAGNFSASSVIIYDPLAALQANGTRSPFPGNIIPSSRLNSAGVAIANTYQTADYRAFKVWCRRSPGLDHSSRPRQPNDRKARSRHYEMVARQLQLSSLLFARAGQYVHRQHLGAEPMAPPAPGRYYPGQ